MHTYDGWWILRATTGARVLARPTLLVVREELLRCTDLQERVIFSAHARSTSVRVRGNGDVVVTAAGQGPRRRPGRGPAHCLHGGTAAHHRRGPHVARRPAARAQRRPARLRTPLLTAAGRTGSLVSGTLPAARSATRHAHPYDRVVATHVTVAEVAHP